MSNFNSIQIIPIDSISPQEFFNNYVSTRTPVIVSQLDKNLSPILSDLKQLKKLAGNQIIQVEQKVNGNFGSGKEKKTMEFSSLIDFLESGSDDLYLVILILIFKIRRLNMGIPFNIFHLR